MRQIINLEVQYTCNKCGKTFHEIWPLPKEFKNDLKRASYYTTDLSYADILMATSKARRAHQDRCENPKFMRSAI